MKKIYYLAFLICSGWLISDAHAQDTDRIKSKIEAANGKPSFIEFKTEGKAYRLEESEKALRTHLELKPKDELKQKKVETDEAGFTHQRFEQYYNNIKVEHGTYIVHAKKGVIHTMNGELKKIENFSTTPTLSESAALQKALEYVNAQTYMWQVADQEKWIKKHENNTKASFKPKGELVIVDNQFAKTKEAAMQPVLAFKFDIYAQEPLSREYIYVDAKTGEVVFKDAIIKHATATGSAATRYSGTRTITTDSYNGSHRLREFTRGNGIETYNCKTGTSYTAAVDFSDTDNNWSAAEFNNAAKDNAGLDAHWAAQMTYDYFKLKHNRNSYDNNGAKIKSYVHYDSNYENAFWNGSVMTYGDGATRFDPLTSLDVGAHEIGHAVCSNSANLVYSYESGAMNEGFSDIWAAAVEYYAAPEKSTWLIGEDIDKQRPSLRSMSNPKAEGQPDTYKGTNWYTGSGDNGGVHYNSGVLNHWFYILSVGKTGTNDIGTSYSVSGIGIEDAAKIAYRTETVYLTSNSVYANARTYSIQSAVDLFGAGSNQVVQTTNAWNAVGIGSKYGEISYCASQGNNSSYEWIAKIQIGAFSNTSGASGYSNLTNITATLPTGANAVSLTPGFASTAYNEYWKIWIDYNKDGDFDDSGELAFDGGSLSNTTKTGTMTIPATASGTTRMRVSMKYNGAQTQCEAFAYGEVEDYTVTFSGSSTPTCAVPGTLNVTSITTSSATLSWGAVSGATSYNVRYRATGTTTWSTKTATGTSTAVSGLSASTGYEFQVNTVCSGASSAYSASRTFTTSAPTSVSYCASKGNNSSYEWIDLVQYAGINKTSGNDGGYKNNTDLAATVARGASTTIYFSAGFQSSSYTEYWRVWIDWNQDGDFTDAGEQMVAGSSSSSATLSSTFTVPSTALLGSTRMRVSMKYNAAQSSCESFTYGEVEDYTVNVTNSLTAGIASFGNNKSEILGDELTADFTVYPNPASDNISFKAATVNTTVKIITLTGAVVKNVVIANDDHSINITDLPSGIYIISIHDGQKELHQRLVKQ